MPDDRSDAQRAYDLGVTATQVKTTLDAHERRLAAINGTNERTNSELAKIHARLDDLVGDRNTRVAVELALTTAARKQVTTVQFYIGIGLFLIALVGLYLGAR